MHLLLYLTPQSYQKNIKECEEVSDHEECDKGGIWLTVDHFILGVCSLYVYSAWLVSDKMKLEQTTSSGEKGAELGGRDQKH